MTISKKDTRRIARAALAVLAIAGVSACSDVLTVKNPGAIEATNINDPYYLTQMTYGVIGEFQLTLGQDVMYASVLGDELRNAHVYSENYLIDERMTGPNNGTYAGAIYGGWHRARFLADSVAGRFKTLLGDSASRYLNLARVLTYGAYTYTFLGEQYCSTPINVSAPQADDQVLAMAIPRFDEAISVATKAKAWAQAYTPDAAWSATALNKYIAGADSIMNFARIGAARTYLDMNNKAKAIEYASAVTPVWTSDATMATRGFQWFAYFLDGTFNNPMWAAAATAAGSGSRSVSLDATPYAYIVDRRIPTARMGVMDGSNDGKDPAGPTVKTTMEIMASSAFSNWNNALPGAEISKSSNIRVASAIEAKYILAEAQGPTAANVDFINSRRALTVSGGPTVGGTAPLPYTVDATTFRNAVIEQRTLDMFIDGHRIGDLRRYKKYYSLDFWPSGSYPGSTTGLQYGTDECWPIPTTETNTNPNIPKT